MERDVGVLDERFNALHEQLYGFRNAGHAVGDRQPARDRRGRAAVARAAAGRPRRRSTPSAADEGEILFEGERRPTPIYDRATLAPGQRLSGPAIVTEFDSTTVVLPGYAAEVDRYFNILIATGGGRMSIAELRSPRSRRSRSTRSRWTSSRTPCATRASRWTPCSSAAP